MMVAGPTARFRCRRVLITPRSRGSLSQFWIRGEFPFAIFTTIAVPISTPLSMMMIVRQARRRRDQGRSGVVGTVAIAMLPCSRPSYPHVLDTTGTHAGLQAR